MIDDRCGEVASEERLKPPASRATVRLPASKEAAPIVSSVMDVVLRDFGGQ